MSYTCINHEPFAVGESPRWNEKQQILMFTDVPMQKLHIFDPKTGSFSELPAGKNVSGFCFNKDGRIVCATHTGLYLLNMQGDLEFIANEAEGNFLKCNDCTADAYGRFIFGTSFYDPGLRHGDRGNLYVMDPDRTIRKVDEGFVHANGMAFSPDGKLFYFTDCAARTIYVYEYDLKKGVPEHRKVFAKIPLYQGIPDGMAVDRDGYVWSAQWYGGVLVRYDPAGNVDFVIRTPAQQTSALAFGGSDLCDIYVTSAGRWAYLEDTPTHYEYDVLEPGGGLYKFNYGIAGCGTKYADID